MSALCLNYANLSKDLLISQFVSLYAWTISQFLVSEFWDVKETKLVWIMCIYDLLNIAGGRAYT